MTQPPSGEIDVNAVLEQLDPLGRALFDAALGRARVKKLVERIEELERQQQQEG